MVIAVLATPAQKSALLARPADSNIEWVWADGLRSLLIIDADAYFDLLFNPDAGRIDQLKKLLPRPVFVSTTSTFLDIPEFIRLDAQPQALAGTSLLLNASDQALAEADSILTALRWRSQNRSAASPAPLILSIDTALERGGSGIARAGDLLAERRNDRQQDHASWVHIAIRELLAEAGVEMSSLSAVAVVAGPGSYTGLRVGMATAKGICYALKIPLLTLSTLELLALALRKGIPDRKLVCPMIDARRMEVFTAVYGKDLQAVMPESALVLDEYSFQHILDGQEVFFGGNGSHKWQNVCIHHNARFSAATYDFHDISTLASAKFQENVIADLAYAEPSYVKAFYSGTKDA